MNYSLLFEVVKKEKPRIMVGASGSFDTFYALLRHRSGIVADDGPWPGDLPLRF